VHYPGSGEFHFTVKDLVEGEYWFRITETTPGGGWTANTGPQLVRVVVSGHTVTVPYPGSGTFAFEDEDGFVLLNFPCFVMPRAGNFSLLLFTAGGVALLGSVAFLGLVSFGRKRRKQKAG